MPHTTYYIPVSFARFQDPSTRSDAPASGAPAPSGSNPSQAAAPGQGATGEAQPQPCGDGMLWMMPAFLAMMYFLMIRPEQKRKKEQQNLLASIKQGDKVVTVSGMHGEVSSMTDTTVTLRVDTVHMTFDRNAVGRIEREPEAEGADAKVEKS